MIRFDMHRLLLALCFTAVVSVLVVYWRLTPEDNVLVYVVAAALVAIVAALLMKSLFEDQSPR
jgi:hypothetical protein